jgi:adenylate cyclase class 2
MLEVEMKFRVADLAPLEARLRAIGAHFLSSREDNDHYFNAPDRDFARTDEAFRLRQIGENNLLTYKGPKRDLETKTRKEIEAPLAPGNDARRDAIALIQALGYRPVACVSKRRRLWQFMSEGYRIEVSLDDVTGVGTFAEIEIQAEEAAEEAARRALAAAARSLGLTESERRSYLEMWLEREGEGR